MKIRQLNDDSLEYAIALTRWMGIAWAAGGFLLVVLATYTQAWRLLAAALLLLLAGAGLIWFGWFTYGNPEWRREKPREPVELCTSRQTVQVNGEWLELGCDLIRFHPGNKHRSRNPFVADADRSWTT